MVNISLNSFSFDSYGLAPICGPRFLSKTYIVLYPYPGQDITLFLGLL